MRIVGVATRRRPARGRGFLGACAVLAPPGLGPRLRPAPPRHRWGAPQTGRRWVWLKTGSHGAFWGRARAGGSGPLTKGSSPTQRRLRRAVGQGRSSRGEMGGRGPSSAAREEGATIAGFPRGRRFPCAHARPFLRRNGSQPRGPNMWPCPCLVVLGAPGEASEGSQRPVSAERPRGLRLIGPEFEMHLEL